MKGNSKLFFGFHFIFFFRTCVMKWHVSLERQAGHSLLIAGMKEVTENCTLLHDAQLVLLNIITIITIIIFLYFSCSAKPTFLFLRCLYLFR